ncbi:B12-binding domain-containing radical SAM protein [bacterium]|nr:B12-binding domain-containing radical SAM protein [bacterium]
MLYIASSLQKNGHVPYLLNARYCKKPRQIPIPEKLSQLKEIYQNSDLLFKKFFHFGMNYDDISLQVEKIRPDVVGINSMFTTYYRETLETAKSIKDLSKNIPIITGGHHATVDPESLIDSEYIDRIIAGEGELALNDLLNSNCFEGSDNTCHRIDDLDYLPFPKRDLISPEHFTYNKKQYSMILTSRGCPHNCTFCSVHALSGHAYRHHSIEYTIDEIEECVNKHGIRAIDFQDDNLLFKKDRIKELLVRIIQNFGQNDLELLASNGLNTKQVDMELLTLMKKAGFKKLDIALGTGDVPTREQISRPEDIGSYENVLSNATKLGLSVTTYIILGLPHQPISEMQSTIDYLKTKDTLISPSIFYNVPGMPIFNDMLSYEYVHDHVARRSSAFNCFGKNFQREDIVKLFEDIRRYNLSHKN